MSGRDAAGPLAAVAAVRLILGGASVVAPRLTIRALGIAPSPELVYMTRIYGARAIALGLGWALSGADARPLWQRLALGVDTSDTVAGLLALARRDVPDATASALTALTGACMAAGWSKLLRDSKGKGRP